VNRLQNNRLQSLFELIHRLVPNDDEEDNDGDGDKMHSSDTENIRTATQGQHYEYL
jgi:hypothetical protein